MHTMTTRHDACHDAIPNITVVPRRTRSRANSAMQLTTSSKKTEK
jgi:hypothetical protein